MSFKKKFKSLAVFRRQHLEDIIVSVEARPYLSAILNLFLIVFVRLKRLLRKIVRRSVHIPETVSLQQPRSLPARLHVLLVVEESIPHCFRYRVQQKIEQLEICGYKASWISWKERTAVREAIHFNHVVIFYRVPAMDEGMVGSVFMLAKGLNKLILYDIDDLIFNRKIIEENLKEGFAKRLTHKERSALLTGTELYSRAISLCPYTIGSTPALCGELAQLSHKTYLHRNALDTSILEYVRRRPPKITRDFVTIFYGSGTRTHDGDFEIAAPSLIRVLETFPEVRLTIVGFLNLPEEFESYHDRIDRIALLSNTSYWEFLQKADISIAPLRAGIFSDCKSEIKWLEAAIMKVPSVVSDAMIYREIVLDGENGLMASNSAEWYDKLASLVQHREQRENIGQNAYDAARAGYLPEVAARNLDGIIQDVLSRETHNLVARPEPHKKRIVYVNVLYPPNDLGGATVMAKNHIEVLHGLHGSAFEVAVFAGSNCTPAEAYSITEYEHQGVHVTSIGVPLMSNIDWHYQDERVYELFRRYLEFQQPELVHFHSVQRLTASVLEAARECGIPHVVTLHDSWWLCDRQFMIDEGGLDCGQFCADPLVCSRCVEDSDKSVKRRSYLTDQLKQADLLLAVSQYQQELYRQNGFDHVVLNRNGVRKSPHVRRLPHTGRLRMGYVGGICAHKGYFFLKEVVENTELRQTDITVVDFDLRPGETRSTTWGSTPVHFISKVPSADMPEFYSCLDVLIVPSLVRESFGLITREALLHGVWVVAAETGGLAEDIRHGIDGHIFGKGSKDELCSILLEIDKSPSFYLNRDPVDTSHIRSVEEQVGELVTIYEKILNSSHHSPSGSKSDVLYQEQARGNEER